MQQLATFTKSMSINPTKLTKVKRNLLAAMVFVLLWPFYAVADYNAGLYAHQRGDYATAYKEWKPLAEQGNASAQVNLGYLYVTGQGVQQNHKTALKWFRKSAAHGNKNAQKKLNEIAEVKRPSGNNSDSSYTAVDRNLVRDIQSHLKALGYDLGAADGIQGRRTTAAVKAFQREWDIQPDGILSTTLLKVLKIALAAKSKSDQPVNKPVNKELSLAGSGTGFLIDSDYVITNYHVVNNCSKLIVYINGNPVSGSLAASSDNDDLALIKLTTRASYQASFRGSGRARLGESIWVVGYPLRTLLASGLNVVSGEISALAGLGNNNRVMQISAPVQLGNSGGPLLDSSGNVIGVIVSKLDAKRFADAIGDIPQNINFAIKGTVVKSFLDTHGIDYQTASSSSWDWTKKNGEEIAAKAREFTIPVECYK